MLEGDVIYDDSEDLLDQVDLLSLDDIREAEEDGDERPRPKNRNRVKAGALTARAMGNAYRMAHHSAIESTRPLPDWMLNRELLPRKPPTRSGRPWGPKP